MPKLNRTAAWLSITSTCMFSNWKKKIISGVFAITLVISNPVVSNDEATIDVNVSGLSSTNYLQGMFTKSIAAPSYFGYTQNNGGDWYKYSGSYTKEEIQLTFFSFTPQDSSWSGQLKIKNDPADPDYTGPGTYVLRVKRYTGGSDSAAQTSNDLNVDLAYVLPLPTPTPGSTSTPTPMNISSPAPTPTKTPTPASTATKTPTPLATATKSPTPKPTPVGSVESAAVGEDLILGLRNELNPTQSPSSPEAKSGKKFPVFPVILIISGLLCIGGAVFAFFKNAKNN